MFEAEGKLPDTLVACIGGGSNAIGLFHPFLDDDVEIIGVEAAGLGISTKQHAASLTGGRPGVLHGNRTYLLQNNDGQITEAHSISAGLDYPGIGPEHSWLFETGRIEYVSATDNEALEAFALCSKLEGIIPALEPSHALAYIKNIISSLPKDHIIVMNIKALAAGWCRYDRTWHAIFRSDGRWPHNSSCQSASFEIWGIAQTNTRNGQKLPRRRQ